MKKRIVLSASLAALGLITAGCVNGYVPNNSYAAVPPGLIYHEATHPSAVLPKMENTAGVQVLGDVEGSASAVNVLLLVAQGDNSVAAAKAEALRKYPAADDILNMEVETHVRSILSLFTTVKTTVRGKAVQYLKK